MVNNFGRSDSKADEGSVSLFEDIQAGDSLIIRTNQDLTELIDVTFRLDCDDVDVVSRMENNIQNTLIRLQPELHSE